MLETPFHNGDILRIQIGSLINEENQKTFRYTRPMIPQNGFYRLTLQRHEDSEHIPYIFDLSEANSPQEVKIHPKNDDSLQIWTGQESKLKQEFREAIEVVLNHDIFQERKDL